MMAKDMPNHSGPVVNERAGLTHKGEVSGVCDAVVVIAAEHIFLVHSEQ